MYSILCPHEAAKILCPALCFLFTCQCMTAGDGRVPERTSFGPGLVHWLCKGLPASSQLPKKLPHFSTRFPALPCLAVCSIAQTLQQPPEAAARGTGESLGVGVAAGEIPPSPPLFQAQFCSLPGSTSYFSSLSMAKAT